MRHLNRTARPMAALAAALALVLAPGAAPAAPPSDPFGALRDLVVAKAHARATGAATAWVDTRVGVLKSHGGSWVLGTATLVAPGRSGAYPDSRLFLAERRNGSWEVGLDGEPTFAEISARAPMLSADEREIFASHGGAASPAGTVGVQANGDYRTGMRLPFGVSQEWTLSGGPHPWNGVSGPWSSIDLAGGDGRVLAARRGTAYENPDCRGEIVVAHDRGYTTKYYHLVNRTVPPNGVSVGVGAFLGNIGTAIPCGGSANSPHVHFTLMQHGAYVNIAYHIIGKWVFINGSQPYFGYALHGSRVAPAFTGRVRNYGALGFDSGVVDANDGGAVNKRSGPGTNYPVVGTVADGVTVKISCSRNGTTHTGRWGTTSLWNRLTDGTWVSDAFVYTGLNGPVSGVC